MREYSSARHPLPRFVSVRGSDRDDGGVSDYLGDRPWRRIGLRA